MFEVEFCNRQGRTIAMLPVKEKDLLLLRFTYPVREQTLNAASYGAASSAIGGDLVATKLLWNVF